jgi:diguanylate cyclase (GGDEF)-like protein
MSDRDSPTRRLIAIGILAAVAVGAGSAATGAAPEAFDWPLRVAIPAVLAGLGTPLLARVFFGRRVDDARRHANVRVAEAKRALHDERAERQMLRELDRALDQVVDEREAIRIIRESFTRHFGKQPMELHLVDSVDPVLTLGVATGRHETVAGDRGSPWDSLAARTNATLTYETTDHPDVCGHLKSRLPKPMSAIAVPLNATSQLLGVLYHFRPPGLLIDPRLVDHLEDIAGVIAARIAVIRTATSGLQADAVDRLTGLPDRSAMQERVLRLLKERQSFTVAVADIDGFGHLNDIHGREAGDNALQILSRVARRTIRPDDVVGRIGGDELLFILPRTTPGDATRAFERLREELVLAQTTDEFEPFTLSIGVIGSSSGGTIEEILHRAAGALNHAKNQGGNRVIVAQATSNPAT